MGNDAEPPPRVLLVSVPYALKAGDAATLGGKPASSFALVEAHAGGAGKAPDSSKAATTSKSSGSSSSTARENAAKRGKMTPAAIDPNFIAEFADATGALTDSPLFDLNGNVGIGTTTPTAPLDVNGTVNATAFSGDGPGLTNLTPGNINAGTAGIKITGNAATATTAATATNAQQLGGVPAANYARLNIANNFTTIQTITSTGIGLWGESTGTGGGADGVHGVAHGPASGVAGVNTDTNGVGVWGQSPGWSFFSTGDVHQERAGGGWVKAMISVDALTAPYHIVRCFNSTLAGAAATTPPCGINFTEVRLGFWRFDFGFRVDDRFFSATLTSASVGTEIQANHSGSAGPTIMFVFTNDSGFTGRGAWFDLIVF